MSSSIVTLVLVGISFCLSAVNFFLYLQARDRKVYAFVSVASLNSVLRRLRRNFATPEYKDDVEFAALLARFEAAHLEARSALQRGFYTAVITIVDGVWQELVEFWQAQELKRTSP